MVPGPVVYSTKELVSIINNNEFDLSKVEEFSLKWNQYSKGNSSESFIREIFKI
ncbi:CDP-glycerol glycerophosphotransferase family protein [Bacillus sp. D-CC]